MNRYSIAELARLAGVSRRTVRFYVQEGLMPPPRGLGRGAWYGEDHLARLLEVKRLQERGLSLREIRAALARPAAAAEAPPVPVRRSLWRRLEIAPGVELHVEAGRRLPPPGVLEGLRAWCERHMPMERRESDAADGS